MGMLTVMLTFVMSSTGCASVMDMLLGPITEETEMSKAFYNAATGLVLEKEDGINADTFRAAFERKFPGLKAARWGQDNKELNFTYQGNSYVMKFSAIVQTRGNSYVTYLTGVTACQQLKSRSKS
ncbi:MAG: hypothetical protein Pg6C_06240 [Treponemataceae bacterium]|nr:MAG: hypothetical protein Pg6C_06240 [Treponemataceae bacterium]